MPIFDIVHGLIVKAHITMIAYGVSNPPAFNHALEALKLAVRADSVEASDEQSTRLTR